MRSFLFWLVLYALGYGALWGGSHVYLSGNPERIAIVVDSSFAMKRVWSDVPALVESLSIGRKYAQFAIISEKRLIHGWRDQPALGNLSPYAPLDLSKLSSFSLLDQAGRVYFITNAPGKVLADLSGWEIVRGQDW